MPRRPRRSTRDGRPRRRWPARLWRAVFYLAAVAAAAALLIVSNCRSIVLFVVNSTLGGALRLEASDIDFVDAGKVWAGNLRLLWANSKTPFIEAEEAYITFDPREVFKGRLTEVHILRPVITTAVGLPEPSGAAVAPRHSGQPPSLPASTARGQDGGFPLEIDRFTVENGRYRLNSANPRVPEIDLLFSIDTGNLSFLRGEQQSSSNHYLVIKRARVTPPGMRLPILEVPAASVGFNPLDVIEDHTIAFLGIVAPTIETGAAMQRMLAPATPPEAAAAAQQLQSGAPSASQGPKWSIRDLDIKSAKVKLRDLALGLPEADFDFSARLEDVPIEGGGGWEAVEGATTTRRVVIDNISIPSPFDALTPVFELGRVTLEFKPVYLLRESLIDSVVIERPRIYIGEDLFWYIERTAQKGAAPTPAGSSPGPPAAQHAPNPWRVRRFVVSKGEIYLATGGQVRGKQPFEFSSYQENLRLESFNSLRTRLDLTIKPSDFPFPAYELKVEGLAGDLKFGFPPERDENNIVQKLEATRVRWRQFTGENFWISVTYDMKGINGGMGGKVCGGYVSGAANFFLKENWPWTAWVNIDDVDLRDFTNVFTPDMVKVDGRADANVYVNATSTRFDRIFGRVKTKGSGVLNITKLNEMIAGIGPDWPKLNASFAKLGIETLRDFDFNQAEGAFWFAGEEGRLDLDFIGPAGRRKIEGVIHPAGGKSRIPR